MKPRLTCQVLVDGEPCGRPVREPSDLCGIHGSAQPRTQRLLRGRMQTRAGMEDVKRLLQDPDLLDVRLPLAESRAVLERTPIVASEELALTVARRRILRDLGPSLIGAWRQQISAIDAETKDEMLAALDALLEPTEGDLEEATLHLHERSSRLLAAHAKTQVDAVKALEWAKARRDVVLPLLMELSIQIGAILRRWVPPGNVPQAMNDVQDAIDRCIGAVATSEEQG